MICTKCGAYIEDGNEFCSSCGTKVNTTQNNTAYGKSANPYAAPGFAQAPTGGPNVYQAPPQTGYVQQPVYQNPADRVPTLGEYIKWMFLYPLLTFIPIAGFIIYIIMCFKNAFDVTYKARANYFKAYLVIWAISIGIFVVIGILLTVLAITGVFAISDIGYYL